MTTEIRIERGGRNNYTETKGRSMKHEMKKGAEEEERIRSSSQVGIDREPEGKGWWRARLREGEKERKMERLTGALHAGRRVRQIIKLRSQFHQNEIVRSGSRGLFFSPFFFFSFPFFVIISSSLFRNEMTTPTEHW